MTVTHLSVLIILSISTYIRTVCKRGYKSSGCYI